MLYIRKVLGRKRFLRFMPLMLIIFGFNYFTFIPAFGLTYLDVSELFEKKYVHDPYKKYQCGSCHVGTPPGRKLKKSVPDLCFSCHALKQMELNNASVHFPFRQSGCLECHESHESDHPSLLCLSPNDLCYECHPEIKNKFLSSPHKVINKSHGRRHCMVCHKAHTSDNPPLLVKSAIELCLPCHEGYSSIDRENHPVGKNYVDARRGRELTCTSTCHEPHGTSSKYMLRKEGDGLCLTCHDASQLP